MRYDNAPDDWFQYLTVCPVCKERYHLSETHDCPGEPDEDDRGVEDMKWGDCDD